MGVEVSVVVPTYRRPRELAAALGSALGQAGVELEVIVVDDCPDGSARPVVEGLGDPRVRYVRNPVPTGGRPAAVRNLGWPHAGGTYVHFLDDDDLVPDGHYAAVLAAFAETPDVGVVFGRIEPFGEDAASVDHERAYFARAADHARRCRRFGRKWGFAARMVFHETLLVCSAAVIRRDCLAALGGFDTELPVVEDVDFYARAIRRFGARFLDRVTLHYRIGRSLMRQPDVQALVDRSYPRMHANYRAQWGGLDFLALKLFARTVS